jgi:hypothetical protein
MEADNFEKKKLSLVNNKKAQKTCTTDFKHSWKSKKLFEIINFSPYIYAHKLKYNNNI